MCALGYLIASYSGVSRSVIHPTRLETRTKESNICASLTVLNRPARRNESNFQYDPGCSWGLVPGTLGAILTRSDCLIDSWTEFEHTCWYPKDGELCLGRTKPEETLVEVCSDSDVQIDRQTWV